MSTDSLSSQKKENNKSLQIRPTLSSRAYSYNSPTRDKRSPIKKGMSVAPGSSPGEEYKNYRDMFLSDRNGFTGRVFGVSLSESLSIASAEVIVQSELVSFGRIPIVVAKCGAYLKANGLETQGIFRIAGNNKRVKELQFIFSSPPDYGSKFNNWEPYTVHDVASLLRRFLNNLKEPLIPLALYDDFRIPLTERPRILKHMMSHNVSHPNADKENSLQIETKTTEQDDKAEDGDEEKEDEATEEQKKRKKRRHKKRLARDIRAAIKDYETLFSKLTNDSKQLTIYLLDLLSLFARQSQLNLMSGRNLAAIFQPSILSHPQHDMDPKEYELSRFAVEFLIEYSYKLLPYLLKLAKEEQEAKLLKQKVPDKLIVSKPETDDENSQDENVSSTNVKPIEIPTNEKGKLSISNPDIMKEGSPKQDHIRPPNIVDRTPKRTSSKSLRIPKQTRPHSKSIGSTPVPPDVIASNKRRTRLFSWLHKPGILSDTGDLTATDDDIDEENTELYGQSPMSTQSTSYIARQNLAGPSRTTRSFSGNSTSSSFKVRPMSMMLSGSNNKSIDELDSVPVSEDKQLEQSKNENSFQANEERAPRSKKRESWFQRLTLSGSVTRE